MKSFLISLMLISSAHAAYNTDIECYRDKTTYSFQFTSPWKVAVSVTDGTTTFVPASRSVPFSEGRMVGMMNEISGEEELFLLPHAIFNPANLAVKLKTEVMLRGGFHFYLECLATR